MITIPLLKDSGKLGPVRAARSECSVLGGSCIVGVSISFAVIILGVIISFGVSMSIRLIIVGIIFGVRDIVVKGIVHQ